MKKKTIILISLIIVYLLYAVFTGGLVFEFRKDFGGQGNVEFVKGLDSNLCLSPKSSYAGIPFLGFYYLSNLPCSLRIQISDKEKKYKTFELDSVVIEYADGQKLTLPQKIIKKLKPDTLISYSGKIIKTPILSLRYNIPDVVNRNVSCKITLKGKLTTSDDRKIPFEVTEEFDYESDFRIYTYWDVLASC